MSLFRKALFSGAPRQLCNQLAAARNYTSTQLMYDKFGDPREVLYLKHTEVNDAETHVDPGQVLVKTRAASVLPADINTIQGVYPVRPSTFPAVGGMECYGVVEEVGEGVKWLRRGDVVCPTMPGIVNTWQSHFTVKADALSKLDSHLSMECLAQFIANPPTAYRMIHDFGDLRPGDTLIQNGGNSAVGRNVIQICKILGFRTINIIWKPDMDRDPKLKDELMELGADYVFTDEEMYAGAVKKMLKGGYKSHIKNGLNCVGGDNAMHIASMLDKNGVMVTYGAMSHHSIHCPTAPLIFKNVSLVGFWMTKWYGEYAHSEKKSIMWSDIAHWMQMGLLKPPPTDKVSIDQYKHAIDIATSEHGKKQLLVFQ